MDGAKEVWGEQTLSLLTKLVYLIRERRGGYYLSLALWKYTNIVFIVLGYRVISNSLGIALQHRGNKDNS